MTENGKPPTKLQAMVRRSGTWPLTASAWVIDDLESYSLATDMIKQIKTLKKHIETEMEPSKTSAHKAWRSICDLISKHTQPLDEGETILKKKCLGWQKTEKERRLRHEAECARNNKVPEAAPAMAVSGVTLPELWRYEIFDVNAFLKFKAGQHYDERDQELVVKAFGSQLQKHATANGDNIPIPGVRFFKETSMGVRI